MEELILKYFPGLTPKQSEQFRQLGPLYAEWNQRINVISRKDMDNLYLHHVLHSLSIARFISITAGTTLLDVGTGGGFPGIPLAILFPDCHFTLTDSIGKKIRVVEAVSEAAGLLNVTPLNTRAEAIPGRFEFILGRAVSSLTDFIRLVRGKIVRDSRNDLANGVLYLSGGEAAQEAGKLKLDYTVFDISTQFSESYFETKKLVHLVL